MASIVLSACAGNPLAGGRATDPESATSGVSAGQIALAIRQHVAEKTRADGGTFSLPYQGRELRLKLVRIHMEYLADLGQGRQFACVDLADVTGDVYDVDFFLAGDATDMKVTETTVHKINGQPLYAWKQKADKTWHRIPVATASPRELGVITGRDEFEFRYRVELPALAASARMWLPFPESDPYQTVEVKSISGPGRRHILRDRDHGNRILFVELSPDDGRQPLEIVYEVQRTEQSAYAEAADVARHLRADRMVPLTESFVRVARETVRGDDNELMAARALYDHVADGMRYMKYGPGWGKGDAVYACTVGTGNCTEYHSYFIALARSIKIPSRFVAGVAVPAARNEGGIDGYHCWAEFYVDGKWWPVDISESDKYSRLSSYYFGHQPANRIELSRGRDLVVDPLPASGPINFLAYPLLEVNGAPEEVTVEFSFARDVPVSGVGPRWSGIVSRSAGSARAGVTSSEPPAGRGDT